MCCILNLSIMFRQNNLDSGIKTNQQFHIMLVEQLTKSLLLARANPESGGGRRHMCIGVCFKFHILVTIFSSFCYS